MGYKILYIDDQESDSKVLDLRELGYEVEFDSPTSDMSVIMGMIDDSIDAIILDYRLTEHADCCFDAPTIAQTIRSKHSSATHYELPIVLMSNEEIITNYYTNFTSKDLFDFALTKQDFNRNQALFKRKLDSFIEAYEAIGDKQFQLEGILGVDGMEDIHIQPEIKQYLEQEKYREDRFAHSFLIYHTIFNSSGLLIDENVLSARLGVSKESEDWGNLCQYLIENFGIGYTGIFSSFSRRFLMRKVSSWWDSISENSLRRLNAEERVQIIKNNTTFQDLISIEGDQFTRSTNYWTVCKGTKQALDPFDGIELINNYHSWEEKEYLSFMGAIRGIDKYKDKISAVDKRDIRTQAQNLNNNG